MSVGEVVDVERLGQTLGEPLRLVRIQRILTMLEPDLEAPVVLQIPDDGGAKTIAMPTYFPHRRVNCKSPL